MDANRDGIPDVAAAPPPAPQPALLVGPAGLPVDGLVGDHTGTFLHELGHNFGLRHGGGDTIQWKPNFISIMNYHWQRSGLSYDWNGDGLGDAVGLDFDGNGIPDARRYQYSSFGGSPPMPTLNEGATPPPAVVNETTAPAPWSRLLTKYTCPAVSPGPPNPVVNVVPIFQPINWDCAAGATTPVDIDNVAFSSGGAAEILSSFDDYNLLANGGLDSDPTNGIGLYEWQALQAATQRIVEPGGREEFVNKCRDIRRLDFEDQPAGTAITTQYPLVTFLADGARRPTIVGPPDRNNVPTSSPKQSLLNRQRGGAVAPLVFTFAEPQRVVQLKLGQAGLANVPTERVRVVVEAFDQNDLPMGRLVKPLPPPSAGITVPVTAAAVFPDELIRRVEVRYETGLVTGAKTAGIPLAEPVQMDDLVFCGRLDDRGAKPSFPPPPKWGDLAAELQIQSEALMEVAGKGEPGNTSTIPWPFTGLTVTVDGAPVTTAAKLTRPEGTTLKIKAPLSSSTGPFIEWRYGNGISFGRGVNEISFNLLRNGTLTAVYQGRRYEPPRQNDAASVNYGLEWLRRCLKNDCLGLGLRK